MNSAPQIARIELYFSKSTSGSHVFEAPKDDHAPTIRNIYVRKSAFEGEPPQCIVVTVEAG